MPIQNYRIVKGDPQAGSVKGFHPHFRIPVFTDGGATTIDVNVQSFDGSEVLFAIADDFTPPDPAALLALPNGVNPPGLLALDYVRTTVNGAPMITKDAMALLPTGRGQDLHDAVVTAVNAAIQDDNGVIYAFGSFFEDPDGTTGCHDIHMNQGNPLKSHGGDNGVSQDGALFLFLPAANKWIAVFLAFESQTWSTDDQGNPSAAEA
jgi:uncharacterized protein YukJ